MNKGFISSNLDFIGFGASFLCAIHCALLPFVIAVGLLSGLSWIANPIIENVFIAVSILLAATSLYPSYRNKHHDKKALKIAGIGFALLFVSRAVGHGSNLEVITIVIGGLLIATAHYVNWQLLKKPCACSEQHCIGKPTLKKAS